MPPVFRKMISNPSVAAVGMILLTALLTYGIWIPRLGFYHDDWYMLWSGALRGANSLIPLFSMDRPFMGVIYSLYYRILSDSIPGWHLAALFWRVLGTIAFYWILTTAWPRLKQLAVLGAVLFLVYPGFLAEPNAATKINHLTGYAAALASIAFTLHAAAASSRRARLRSLVLSLLTMALYLWIYEYMLGLEVMRLVLLFWMIWRIEPQPVWPVVKRVARMYVPHVLILAIFLFWRTFLFDSTRFATDMGGLAKEYLFNFQEMALRLVFQTIKDFFSTTVFAWSVQAYSLFLRSTYTEILISFVLAGAVMALAVLYVRGVRTVSTVEASSPPPLVLVGAGVLITLAAVFPVVITNHFLNLMDAYKGYALHPSAGVVVLVLGLVLMLQPKYQKPLLIGLIGLSVLTQSMNGQRWVNFWEVQRSAWWQLSWRAPGIYDYTMVMAHFPDSYPLQQDYEIWGPINLIYRPLPPAEGPNFPLIQAEMLNSDTVLEIFEQTYSEPYVRDIFVPRAYENLLLMSQPTTASCLHVIDGSLPVYSTGERLIVEQVGVYSSTRFIDPAAVPPVLPPAIFGAEPDHGWCYYYQKAALARQTGDWQAIASLFDAAAAAGLAPRDTSEYFVFLEGLVNSGRTDAAQVLAAEFVQPDTALRISLCQSVSQAAEYAPAFGYRQQEIRDFVCAVPPADTVR